MIARRAEITWDPGLSIYASETLLKLVGDEYGWIEGINDKGNRRCILPYSIIKKPFIRMARFRVQTIPVGEELSLNEEKDFLNSAVDYLRGIGADMIIPATTNSIFRTYPDGAVIAPYGTFIVDLNLPEEKLWSNMHSNHRNKVRGAMKSGVEVRTGLDYLDVAFDIISDTLKRSNSHFIKHEEFERFVRGLKENVKILVASYQGDVQGCVVVPFSSHSAYFLYSGRSAAAAPGAMNLLKWEAMLHFRELGVHYFNFVGVRVDPEKGSKQEGLLNSKKRFGGQYVQGYIWKYAIKRLKYALYCRAVRIQRGGDIVDQERNKIDVAEA
jgi:hypothetical protein